MRLFELLGLTLPPDDAAKPMPLTQERIYARHFLSFLALWTLVALLLVLPWSAWWLCASGDVAVERAVQAQGEGFALFGPGIEQDVGSYKLALYAQTRPELVALGSMRASQLRGRLFHKSFLNMAGGTNNLANLRQQVDALLKLHKPRAVIIALDYWWFLPQWQKQSLQATGDARSGNALANLLRPWGWWLSGTMPAAGIVTPLGGLIGRGFDPARFGILAQLHGEGFGPDGSWHHTDILSGQKPAPDFRFAESLNRLAAGIAPFYHPTDGKKDGQEGAHNFDPDLLDEFADICCRLKSRNIQTIAYLVPLAPDFLAALREQGLAQAHLVGLRDALASRGIDALDLSDPRRLGAGNCEFVTATQPGEVAQARIIRELTDRWPALLAFVRMEEVQNTIRDWQGHARTPDARLTSLPETDFLGLACPKRTP